MPKLRAGDVRLEISLDASLHRRLKATCARLHIPIRHLVLDVLTERVEYLEEKRRAEEERIKAEREAAGSRTTFAPFRKLTGSTLAPVPKPTPLGGAARGACDVPAGEPIDYTRHAEKIYAALVGGSPLERRLCTAEAVAAIQRKRPLTCPPENEIVATLERLVLEMREAASAVTREDAPEVIIDPSKVRTFGDVTADEEG